MSKGIRCVCPAINEAIDFPTGKFRVGKFGSDWPFGGVDFFVWVIVCI